MAENSTIDQILGWLRGPTPTPSLGLEKAPPLASYPSQHDADYARNYGFGDNSINEDYLNNNKARILGENMVFQEPAKKGKVAKREEAFVPASGEGQSTAALTNPQNGSVMDLNNNRDFQGSLTNVMMRAGLAANRSPIAAVGFDPSKVIVDTLAKRPSYQGLYSPWTDTAYSALEPDDAVVHESTHRGIRQLRALYPEKAGAILDRLPDYDEMIVRWLMKTKAGDPEASDGPAGQKQIKQAIGYFDPKNMPHGAPANLAALNDLEELAIEHMKGRGKRAGPQ